MPTFSRTGSGKRVFLLALVCVCVLVVVSIVAYGVAGADTPVGKTKGDNAAGNPNYPFPTDANPNPTLAALLHRQATARATMATGFARNPQPANRTPLTPPPTTPRAKGPIEETGIFPPSFLFDDGWIYQMDATIENFYRTFDSPTKPNHEFVVVAGASRADAQAGFVGVAVAEKNGLKPLNKSLTPTKHGSVHIVDVKGNVVVLQAQDGTRFSFDFVTYAFV